MVGEGSSFKQMAQKLSDGRHEVVGLFDSEQSGGTWLERNWTGVAVVAALAMPVMLCSYFYFLKKDKTKDGVDDKEKEEEKIQYDDYC